MNALGNFPWQLSFSFGRALQEPSLAAWARQDGECHRCAAPLLPPGALQQRCPEWRVTPPRWKRRWPDGSAHGCFSQEGRSSDPSSSSSRHLFVACLRKILVPCAYPIERRGCVGADDLIDQPGEGFAGFGSCHRHRDHDPAGFFCRTASTAAYMLAPVASPSSTRMTVFPSDSRDKAGLPR